MDALGSKREYRRRHHGKTINFVAPGVEREARQGRGGLVYGTILSNQHITSAEHSGRHSHTLHEQSSWEKVKTVKQQRDAEEDLQSHMQAKEQARLQGAEEKRKDLELLQEYNPWGKPAAGAPRWTRSGTLLTKRGDVSQQRERSPSGSREAGYPRFGRPGGGAPLMSRDGQVDALMRAHPETRFQKQLRREVENSLRYKGAVEGESSDQRQLVRSKSEEERENQRRSQQSRYARRLADQIEEADERKRQERMGSPLSYFPWGRSSPRRDKSGKLIARKRPKPHPQRNEFQSIVDHMERVGKREEASMAHCTHPFTHRSKCKLQGDSPREPSPERITKQSQSRPTGLQREAEERQRERRREREEARACRNSHQTLWDGGHQYGRQT